MRTVVFFSDGLVNSINLKVRVSELTRQFPIQLVVIALARDGLSRITAFTLAT